MSGRKCFGRTCKGEKEPADGRVRRLQAIASRDALDVFAVRMCYSSSRRSGADGIEVPSNWAAARGRKVSARSASSKMGASSDVSDEMTG